MGLGFNGRLTFAPAKWLLRGLVTLVAVTMLLAVAVRAATPEQEGAEVWEAECLGSKAVAYVHRNGSELSGVLYLTGLLGKTDVYHFHGTLIDGQVKAAHYTGHHFEGHLVSDREVTGVVTTRNGYHLKITSHRRQASKSGP